jgi:hypothetical protein
MDAGPPFASENWNVTAAASHEHCSRKEKFIAEEPLMYRFNKVSNAFFLLVERDYL